MNQNENIRIHAACKLSENGFENSEIISGVSKLVTTREEVINLMVEFAQEQSQQSEAVKGTFLKDTPEAKLKSDETFMLLSAMPGHTFDRGPEAGVLKPWISVKDRLPAQGQSVNICCIVEGELATFPRTSFLFNCKWDRVQFEVTHWMPLPKPPTTK